MNEVHIAICRFDEEPGIRHVRETVFMQEQGVPAVLEWDGEDEAALHAVARNADGEVVATGRLLANGHIGRMAVLPAWRGRGIGSALLRRLMAEARHLGLSRVYLHAQVQAVPFYARHGFTPDGEEFMDAGIPHRRMQCPIDTETVP